MGVWRIDHILGQFLNDLKDQNQVWTDKVRKKKREKKIFMIRTKLVILGKQKD